jgi:hypothetical protein
LQLPTSKAEFLASRLKQEVSPSLMKISKYRIRHEEFSPFFQMEERLCFCSDISGLFKVICFPHRPQDSRLFIDSSTRRHNAVLLHNGNQHPSIPVAYSVHLKEDYGNIKLLLQKVNYGGYQWDICGDFKMPGILLSLQGGYTEYSWFFCLWDNTATDQHYIQKVWPERGQLIPGMHNIFQEALVPRENILLPSLHVELGLLKQFVKALVLNSAALHHTRKMFPH